MQTAATLDPAARYPTLAEELADPKKAASHAAQAAMFRQAHTVRGPSVPLVIYHDECDDGLTAAWCVREAYRSRGLGVELFPARYQQPPPDVTGRHVILVDFSYKRPVLLQMLETCFKLDIYDHHKSAQEDLDGLRHEKLQVAFDMHRSGAGIAWDCFFRPNSRPWFVNYVEDNDLWRHMLPDCKAVLEYLRTIPFNQRLRFYDQEYHETNASATEVPSAFVSHGKSILTSKMVMVEQSAKQATLVRITVPGLGRANVLAANVPFFLSSDVANRLAQHALDTGNAFEVGITWYQRADRKYSLSFRSIEPNGPDVSLIAAQYGGGGHRHAAGATVDRLPWNLADGSEVPTQ